MKNDYLALAKQEVVQAAKALKKPFKAAMAAGMHPDEFWYWLGDEVEPGRPIRPRWVSLASDGKKWRAAKARDARSSKLTARNQEICLMVERSLEQGEARKTIYARIGKLKGVGPRQIRNILNAQQTTRRRKTLG